MATVLSNAVTSLRWPTSGAALRSCFDRFIAWWIGELRALLPPRIRRWLDRRAQRLIVRMDGCLASVWLHDDAEGADEIAVADLEADDQEPLRGVRARLAERAADVKETVLYLPREQALRRTVRLPLEAKERLRDVLAFEMDRLTPFRAEDVYFDFKVLGRDGSSRTLELLLVIVKRATLDRLIQRLHACGIAPSVVQDRPAHPESPSVTINLLPGSEPRSARGRTGNVIGPLWVALGFLSFAALTLPLLQAHRVNVQLEDEIVGAKLEAVEAQATRDQIEAILQQARIFAERRALRPTAPELIRDLTHMLPDETWLTRLELSGDRLRMQGESSSASALIGLLEDSIYLRDASFSAPVTRNPRSDKDRFALDAALESGAKAE